MTITRNIWGGAICICILSICTTCTHASIVVPTTTSSCVLTSDAKVGWKLSTSRSSYLIRSAQKTTNIIRPTLSDDIQKTYPTNNIIATGSCTQDEKNSSALTITKQWLKSFVYWKTMFASWPERSSCTQETCESKLNDRHTSVIKKQPAETRGSIAAIDDAAFTYLQGIFLGSQAPRIADAARTQTITNSSHIQFTDIQGISTACKKYADINESLTQRHVHTDTIDCVFDTLSSVNILIPERPISDGITHYAITYWYDANQKNTFYSKPALRGDTTVVIKNLNPSKKLLYQFSVKPIGLYTYRTY